MKFTYLSDEILITGGNGLVGSEMNFGKQISRSDVDLTDNKKTIEYICDIKPKWVINCAGLVGGVQANMLNKADFFHQNLMITLNVLQACHLANVPNLITFMSTCIFPDKYASGTRLTEEMVHDGDPHFSNNAYAYAKRMIDIGINAYIEQYGNKNWFSLIPTNLYGKHDNYNLETSHIIPALIRKAHLSKINNSDFVVWGTGNPIREFVYANDIAKLVYHIIINDFNSPYKKFIVAPNEQYRISEIAKLIANKFNIQDIKYDNTKPDGQFIKVTNSTKFKTLFPDFEFTLIENGLNETIEYYLNLFK